MRRRFREVSVLDNLERRIPVTERNLSSADYMLPEIIIDDTWGIYQNSRTGQTWYGRQNEPFAKYTKEMVQELTGYDDIPNVSFTEKGLKISNPKQK